MVSTLTEIGAAAGGSAGVGVLTELDVIAGGSAGVEIVVAATLVAAKGPFLRRAWILWVIPVDKSSQCCY